MSRRARVGLGVAVVALAALFAALGWQRFSTFHNETFDLAFYTRMAWGYVHGELWEPIVGANVVGLHLSPILLPLGAIGELVGSIPAVLIAVQAAAVTATAFPLARIGHRRLGDAGAILAGGAWLAFPNIGHVATFEVHPGTMAVLPLALVLDGLDSDDRRELWTGTVLVLLCREDLALVTLLAGIVAWRTRPSLRRDGVAVAAISFAYVLAFALVLHPMFGPRHGSMQLHFGKWGDTAAEAVATVVTRPDLLFAHLTEPSRLLYLPKLLLPVALLPLLRPRWLFIASPLLAMNLLSEWPTTIALDSHYQTTLLPMWIAGAADGAALVARRLSPRLVASGVLATAIAAHLLAGGTPIAADFDASSFTADARTRAAREVVDRIPDGVSVQAPYALMPHLAERRLLGPPPPPDRDYEVVVLDVWHRARYAHDEDLVRTAEEPTVRDWLSRDTFGLVLSAPPYLLLERGAETREGPASRFIVGHHAHAEGRRLAACLGLADASLHGDELVLRLVAHAPCPRDLAIRIGSRDEPRPRRVDLLFGGLLSPERLRAGDVLESRHPLSPRERRRIVERGLRIGLLRSSGARPEHADPATVDVALAPDGRPAP